MRRQDKWDLIKLCWWVDVNCVWYSFVGWCRSCSELTMLYFNNILQACSYICCWGGSKGKWWRKSSNSHFVNSNICLLKIATQSELNPLLPQELSLILLFLLLSNITIIIIITMRHLSTEGWERWSLPLSVCWSRGLRGSTTLWSLCALCLKHTHTITQSQTHMHECKVSKGTRP